MCSFEGAECFTEFFCINFVFSLRSEYASELNFDHEIYELHLQLSSMQKLS